MRQYFVQPTDAVAVAVAVAAASHVVVVRSLLYGPVVYTIVAMLLFDFTNEH